jgi:mono/diheme cytochrome c family protein
MKIGTGIAMIAVLVASTMAIAQNADVYRSKCQNCHGATGVPSPQAAKYVGVRPVTDPAVKGMSQEQMIAITTNGLGKMPAFKGKLTDAEIKDAVSYFRALIK